MSFLQEFKEFAVKGNVIDMAVGVIIGGAFGKIVDSFVKDITMPLIGKVIGGANFSQLYLNLGTETYASLDAAEKAGAPIVKYGSFLTTALDFIIIAFVIFCVIKAINSMKRKQPEVAAPAEPPEEVKLLREIRDSLKKS